jgi:hypothetical protein
MLQKYPMTKSLPNPSKLCVSKSHRILQNFVKFSKSEVLHFRKIEHQRKAPKHDEASRPACYNDTGQHNYPKHVNIIDSDGCGPSKNCEKNIGPPSQERSEGIFDHRANKYNQRMGVCQTDVVVVIGALSSLCIACTTTVTPTTIQKIAQHF